MTTLTNSLRALSLGVTVAIGSIGGTVNAAEYAIDTAHTSITFEIGHLGFSVLAGRFDGFAGTYSFDETNPGAGSVSVTIDPNSVNSNHAERDNHLRSADFLAVTDFPTASFTSKAIEVTGDRTAIITGDFTLRGVTREIQIATEFVGAGDDPWGGYRSGFTGTAQIALADYGIDFDLGPSAREVALTLNVEGIRQ